MYFHVEISSNWVARVEIHTSSGASYAQLDGKATHALILLIGIKNK
jgi:hypothetical protein